mmetsp:Transcript_21204/g.29990  ORF Transcript_21204/g.29990 Transcript_21204/m.29990 type:complete len:157 (+) Transcript_21204:195-665(+)
MSSKHRLTRSFRTLSALVYVLDICCAIAWAWTPQWGPDPTYLHVLIGLITSILSMTMLFVAVEAPGPIILRIEQSKVTEGLFTFRGRYMVDLLIALFLFAMGPWGILMGVITLALIFGIRFIGVKQPESFNEIFRQSEIESTSGPSYNLDESFGQA